jgi:hypothetical protein
MFILRPAVLGFLGIFFVFSGEMVYAAECPTGYTRCTSAKTSSGSTIETRVTVTPQVVDGHTIPAGSTVTITNTNGRIWTSYKDANGNFVEGWRGGGPSPVAPPTQSPPASPGSGQVPNTQSGPQPPAATAPTYFGALVAEIFQCDVGVLLTVGGPHYNGLLMWMPPGGAPPYLVNMNAAPVPTQCITGIMGGLVPCTWGGDLVAMAPVIVNYGSSPPGCNVAGGAGGSPGGGSGAGGQGQSLGSQLRNMLQGLGTSALQGLFGGSGSEQESSAGSSTYSSGTKPDGALQCRSAPGGTPSDVRRANTDVASSFSGSCVSVSATTCRDVLRGGRSVLGTKCVDVGSKECSILSYLPEMCGRCTGATITIVGRESALVPQTGGARMLDVAVNSRLNQCVTTFAALGKTVRGYDAYRDPVTRATWVRVSTTNDDYWHVCAPGQRCN